ERGDRSPEVEPDEERDRQQDPEEDGEAVPLQVVVDDQANRVLRCGRASCVFHATILTCSVAGSKKPRSRPVVSDGIASDASGPLEARLALLEEGGDALAEVTGLRRSGL